MRWATVLGVPGASAKPHPVESTAQASAAMNPRLKFTSL
jgi:hypothetical protein